MDEHLLKLNKFRQREAIKALSKAIFNYAKDGGVVMEPDASCREIEHLSYALLIMIEKYENTISKG